MFAAIGLNISILINNDSGMSFVAAAVGETQASEGIDPRLLIPGILFIALVITTAFALKLHRRIPKWFSRGMKAVKSVFTKVEIENITGIAELDKAIAIAGYSYNPKQDIFYSKMDAWQRNVGYCRLYDEAAAPLNMIIDCEPVYFEYGGKRWLIEFWKGQYALNAGCEIGVYTTEGPDLDIAGVFNGTFYYCAGNNDSLIMSFTLRKNGKIILKRRARHWWLTGFKLGEFAEPSELIMYLSITFKDEVMRDAFLGGLKNAGYSEDEVIIEGNIVRLKFDKPRTPQPLTRIPQTDWIIQRKNEVLCKKYQEITEPYDNFPDKVKAIKEKAPELFEQLLNIGKTKQLFKMYDEIKKYLS